MSSVFPADSVGLVSPKVAHFDEPLNLACGRTLDQYELIYETYGELNATASNAVLICHALSGTHHAAGFHHVDDLPNSACPGTEQSPWGVTTAGQKMGIFGLSRAKAGQTTASQPAAGCGRDRSVL